MAYIIPTPSEIQQLHSIPSAELETLLALRKDLDNNYHIYHGIHWTRENRKSTTFGEIDFIIVNKSGHLLVIEQKNGLLEEEQGELVKNYGLRKKSIYSQIQRSIDGIRNKFKEGLHIDYIIFCPDYKVKDINASSIDMTRTVDGSHGHQRSYKELAARIQAILGPGHANDDNAILKEDLHQFFLNTLNIVLSVSSYKTNQEKVYTVLLEGLADVIDKIEFEPFRLRVIGTAGCGKTQLNVKFVEKMIQQNKKVLFLCFNRRFADQLKEIFSDAIYVNTYHGFCKDNLEKATGIKIDFENKSFYDEGFWQDVQDQLTGADISNNDKYDCLVIDEGQDFITEWYEIIELFLKPGATQLWLEDPLQNIWDRAPVKLNDFVVYRESSNFRTPRTIAEFIQSVLNVDFVRKNPLPGLGAEVFTYDENKVLIKEINKRVTELLKLDFSYDDIVLISCKGFQSSCLYEAGSVGPHTLRKFTGEYDSDNNQIYTSGKLEMDSIYRFKGQERPAVILIDLDNAFKDNDWSRRVLYCAMTRTTVRLELIVHNECPWISRFIENN